MVSKPTVSNFIDLFLDVNQFCTSIIGCRNNFSNGGICHMLYLCKYTLKMLVSIVQQTITNNLKYQVHLTRRQVSADLT